MTGYPYGMGMLGNGSGMMPGTGMDMGGFGGLGMSGMPGMGFSGGAISPSGMPHTGGFGPLGMGMQPNPAFTVTREGIDTPLMQQTGRVQGLQSRLNYIQNLAANGLVNPRFARAEIGRIRGQVQLEMNPAARVKPPPA